MFTTLDRTALRRARSEDAARIARLYIASQGVNGTAASRASLDPATVQRWIRTSVIHDEVWVLEEEFGRLAGVLTLSGNELETLDVDPTLRGRGLGSRLLAHAKSRRPGGLTARLTQGRSTARAFLTHHGFVESANANTMMLTWRTPRGGGAQPPFRVLNGPVGARP